PNRQTDHLIDAGQWTFPTVVGIANSPIMRHDGSLLTKPGYDPATQLWFKSSGDVELPPIPEQPSKADALAALAKLNELLDGFPFAGEDEQKKHSIGRSVALAGMMSPVLRGAMVAVPIFLITAPEARTGKTYLVRLIAYFVTGHEPVPTAGSDRKEEMEKRIE